MKTKSSRFHSYAEEYEKKVTFELIPRQYSPSIFPVLLLLIRFQEPARVLREALRSGVTSLKDRLSIKIENDMRFGEVRVDHWLMHAKVK